MKRAHAARALQLIDGMNARLERGSPKVPAAALVQAAEALDEACQSFEDDEVSKAIVISLEAAATALGATASGNGIVRKFDKIDPKKDQTPVKDMPTRAEIANRVLLLRDRVRDSRPSGGSR